MYLIEQLVRIKGLKELSSSTDFRKASLVISWLNDFIAFINYTKPIVYIIERNRNMFSKNQKVDCIQGNVSHHLKKNSLKLSENQ